MHANWDIDEATVKKCKEIVAGNESKALVKRRRQKNILRKGIDLSKSAVWRVIVGCQVTTMQRSGPGSKVSNFMDEKCRLPNPALDYETCRKKVDLEAFLVKELQKAGLWRAGPVAANLAAMMKNLESGEWTQLLTHLNNLTRNTTKQKERTVALYLQTKQFPGIGPKQSRNLIQWLGLSRYEVPIDTRVVKVLRHWGTTFVPSAAALGDEAVYVFVQDALQKLARMIGIYPCMLDAAIFASFDKE